MTARTCSLLATFSVLLARLASCQRLVPWNSVTEPLDSSPNWFPNIRGGCNPPGYMDCVPPHVLPRGSCTTQLLFSGKSVSVTFLKDVAGVTAIIYIDGQIATNTSTYDPNQTASVDCETITSEVIQLTAGPHNLTVAADISPDNNNSVSLFLTGISYEPVNITSTSNTSVPSTSPSSSQPSPSQTSGSTGTKKPVAAIVGGTIGGLALTPFAVFLFVLVRRKRQAPQEVISVSPPSTAAVSPFITWNANPSSTGNPNGSTSHYAGKRSAAPVTAAPATLPLPLPAEIPQAATTSSPQHVPVTGANVTSHPNAEESDSTRRLLPPYKP